MKCRSHAKSLNETPKGRWTAWKLTLERGIHERSRLVSPLRRPIQVGASSGRLA